MNTETPGHKTTLEAAPLLTISDSQRYLGGISRSTLYLLLERGELRSVSIRVRGNLRGRRMILRESLEDYVSRITDQSTPARK